MDMILINVYRKMLRNYHCSSDDILCDPDYRQEFLTASRQALGDDKPEKVLLKRLASLRKQSKLPCKTDPDRSGN